MSSIANELDAYVKMHKQFTSDMSEIEDVKKDIEVLKNDLKRKEKSYEEKRKLNTERFSKKEELKGKRDNYQDFYDECKGIKKSGESSDNVKVTFIKNEFTDPIIFQKKQEEITTEYKHKEEQYVSQRNKSLVQERANVLKDKRLFQEDAPSQINHIMQQHSDNLKNTLETKKLEVMDYLTCNKKIEKSDLSQKIITTLKNKGIHSLDYINSEDELINNILSLKSTNNYARKQKINLAEFKKYREINKKDSDHMFDEGREYSHNGWYTLLVLMIIGLFFLFMAGFSPVKLFMPSVVDIADASSSAIKLVVKIVTTIFAMIVLGGLAYVITNKIWMSDGLSIIVTAIVVILTGASVFTQDVSIINTEDMLGVANVVYIIFSVILNLIICVLIYCGIDFLILNTNLVNIFFKTQRDVVLDGLTDFANYFDTHEYLYIALFNMEDAIRYIHNNRLDITLSEIEKKINNIKNEKEYTDIDNECRKKLESRIYERESQLKKIESQLEKLNKEYNTSVESFKGIHDVLTLLTREIEKDKASLENKIKLNKKLTNNIADAKNKLLKYTDRIICDGDDFEKQCEKLNTSKELLEAKGNLSKDIYFIKNYKDNYGMAIVRKLPFKCEHTVFVYNRNDIISNNLSEELSPFIQWLSDSIRRINAPKLFYKFTVVDMVSGKSILVMPPFNKYINVISDGRGKGALSAYLSDKIRMVTDEMNRSDIRRIGGDVNNIISLNECKMDMNKEDIEKEPQIPIYDLQEQVVPYNVIIFVIPFASTNGSQPSIMNEEIKQVLMNCENYGIIPIFLVDSITWSDEKNSADVAYLNSINTKSVWQIRNVGKDKKKQLDVG